MSFKVELTNGAAIEMFHYDFTVGYGAVLARYPALEEWITWRVYPSREHEGKFEAETGHYFHNDKPAAYADFKERARYAS